MGQLQSIAGFTIIAPRGASTWVFLESCPSSKNDRCVLKPELCSEFSARWRDQHYNACGHKFKEACWLINARVTWMLTLRTQARVPAIRCELSFTDECEKRFESVHAWSPSRGGNDSSKKTAL